MDKFAFFILNIFVNSLLTFFTTAFLIEGIIFLFRIRQKRVVAYLRIFSIIKLPLDLFLYDFSRWSYLHGINPLDCESGTRMLSISLGFKDPIQITSAIKLTLPEDLTFTIADVIGNLINKEVLSCIALLLLLGCIYSLTKKLVSFKRFTNKLNSLEKTSQTKEVKNPYLRPLFKNKFQIITCPNYSGSPFVVGILSSKIYFPLDLLKTLTRKEYEAILAHEIGHIRYKDNLMNFFLSIIESIFWWVPTRWLRRKIKEAQEIGCDFNCIKYKINPTDLAAAIYKSAKKPINSSDYLFANHLATNTTVKRIKLLLNPQDISFKLLRLILSMFIGYIVYLTILFGRFWTF